MSLSLQEKKDKVNYYLTRIDSIICDHEDELLDFLKDKKHIRSRQVAALIYLLVSDEILT